MTNKESLDNALDQYLTNTDDKPISPPSRLPHYAAAATAILAGTHTDAAIVELGPITNFLSASLGSSLSSGATFSTATTFKQPLNLTSTNGDIQMSVTGSLQIRFNSTGSGAMQYSNYANIRLNEGSNGNVRFATSLGDLRILNPGDQIGYFGSRFIPSNVGIGSAGFASTGTGTFGFALASNALNPTNFGETRRGLIGLSFEKEGSTHYGWIELEYEVDQTAGPGPLGGISLKVDIVNRAWQDTPDASLRAGVIPEPGTLGLLALGFTGVLMQRRRKQAQD